MKKDKTFDCVRMKWDIQRKLEDEMPDLPEPEKRKRQMERVLKNPLLRRFVVAARERAGS